MISIVIPTFNESKNILILINDLITLLEDIDYEIVVVDDDSPDGTSEKVSQEMQNNSNIKLITRVGRSGLASAIKEGLLFARGEYLMVLDGDGQHEPFCVLEMMKEIAKEDCDLVIGSRFLESSKLDGLSERRSIGSQTANMISRLSLPRKYFHITDYLSGCFCLKKEKT